MLDRRTTCAQQCHYAQKSSWSQMPWRGEKNELGLHKGFIRLLSAAQPVTGIRVNVAVFTVYTLVLM